MRGTDVDPYKVKLAQAESLKRMAFFGVAMSTFAAFFCVLSVPIIYNYLQHVQSLLENEVEYCKVWILASE